MVDDRRSGAGAAQVVLPAVLDLTKAAELKQTLVVAMAEHENLTVDAAAVQRITTPCFQILAAAAKDLETQGGGMEFINVPDVFREPADILGLGRVLGLTEV
jgi:anti-anti-sigma regulatory factor